MTKSDPALLVPPRGWLQNTGTTDPGLSVAFISSMTLVGAVLRMLKVLGQSLWVDEILTWHAVRPGVGLNFWDQFCDTIQGPFYLAAVWPLVHAHDTALMLRLPAVVAGIVAVPVFGWLAFRLLDGRSARLALLLFAVNPFLIWYSQEGRGYSFLVLFSLVTALCYFRMTDGKPTFGWAVGFALAAAAMVLSNLSGVFLLVAMQVSLTTLQRPQNRAAWGWWALAGTLTVVLVAPWLLRASGIWAVDRIVPGAGTGAALRGTTTFSPLAIPYAVFTFFFGYSLGPSLGELHQPDRLRVLMAYLPVVGLGMVTVGAALLVGFVRVGRRWLTLAVWILVPLSIAVLLALRNIKPWNPRYVAVAMPWFLLLAGTGLAKLSRRWGGVTAVTLVGLTLLSLIGYYGNGKYAKADVRGAAAWAQAAVSPEEAILVPVVTGVFEFYDRGQHRLIDSYGLSPLATAAEATAYVGHALIGEDSCVIVLAREWYFDPDGYFLPALAALGDLESVQKRPGLEILRWRRHVGQQPDPGRGIQNDL